MQAQNPASCWLPLLTCAAALLHPQDTADWGYWIQDMNQACYRGIHLRLFVPLGICFFAVFCLAPPIINFMILFRVRYQLREPSVLRSFAFMYDRYKPRYYWCKC